jgi:hypothetical protein
MPARLDSKTVVTNTTTEDNIALLKERGVKAIITTTPRYDGRSFGTNMMEAALTAPAEIIEERIALASAYLSDFTK